MIINKNMYNEGCQDVISIILPSCSFIYVKVIIIMLEVFHRENNKICEDYIYNFYVNCAYSDTASILFWSTEGSYLRILKILNVKMKKPVLFMWKMKRKLRCLEAKGCDILNKLVLWTKVKFDMWEPDFVYSILSRILHTLTGLSSSSNIIIQKLIGICSRIWKENWKFKKLDWIWNLVMKIQKTNVFAGP